MPTAIRVIGILIVLEGVLFLFKPDVVKQIVNFFHEGKRVYFASLLRIILAIIFFLGASRCNQQWVIIAFGILMLVSGIAIFIIKLEKLKVVLEWWLGRSSAVIRLIALVVLAFGSLIIYSA